ncbi:MAG: HAD-IIB family hydrolase [Desulfotignum sp.]|nr:HAD-IIB family hydrolase [Desulfotignum sp.]MCF8125735.1 HAD-IIB family hydrolase [Desulfotignum sp.]
MKPMEKFPENLKRSVRYVLTDIDDTLTANGRIPWCAFRAMELLQAAGIMVVPITGRPAGWCDHIARMWPVEGVVGENGAFYFHYDTKIRKMVRRYFKPAAQRRQDRARLASIGQKILEQVPGCIISADQAFREADLAIDFCEDVPALPESEVLRIVDIFHRNGAVAKISSIHVNGWFGSYDKLTMTCKFFKEIFTLDLEMIKDSILFSGDSPNDEPMFEFFPNSVGVANILFFKDTLSHRPAWITEQEGGYGFAEMAACLI